MSEHVVILHAGVSNDSKWPLDLPPKHAMPVPDRGTPIPLIQRTVRQLYSVRDAYPHRLYVTAPANLVETYQGWFSAMATVVPAESGAPSGAGCRPWGLSTNLWSQTGRTTLLLGDVYFTETALRTILDHQAGLFHAARLGPSKVTGCLWGEDFAFSFTPDWHQIMLEGMRVVNDAFQAGVLKRATSWELWQLLEGHLPSEIEVPPRTARTRFHLDIDDDGTDDIDYPSDYFHLITRLTLA